MTGFINIYKPSGMSSARAVSAVKKKLNITCGHMGTLDPMASGVLPVGLGKTTRLFPYLLDKTKTYIAEFTFGSETDTLDRTGEVVKEGGILPTVEQIKGVLKDFIGNISQIPPNYSAKCVDGKRGYQLARKGVEFTLPPKTVRIDEFSFVEGKREGVFTFKIVCGGGTYIRSLCRDLAYKLNTYAFMSELERTTSGIFTLDSAVDVDKFFESENPSKYILPADGVIDYPKVELTEEMAKKILNGIFPNYGIKDGLYRVYYRGGFIGIGESKEGALKVKSYVW